jgi:hypothetical protein
MECFMTPPEAFYYHCAWMDQTGALSVSNNGNFMMLGGGFQGAGNGLYPMCLCVDGVNYCSTVLGASDHTTAKTSGFIVACPAMLYSNTNGCTWTRMPGFCIPNTFFTCLCCDGFPFMACCAGCCGKIEVQWGLGSFTCCNGIWTGFRINNLCCKSHAIFGYACACLLANNTPSAWTVCMRPHPFVSTTWCCGYFSGIGGECDFDNFTVTSPNSGLTSCYSNLANACQHRGAMRPRFIMGKLTGICPSVAQCISTAMCFCVSNACTPICHGICGTCACSGVMGPSCERMVDGPFCYMLNNFFHTGAMWHGTNPTLSFMTCVYGNTDDMTAWLIQLDKSEVRNWYYNRNQGITSSCTLLRWNCGSVCQCCMRNGCFGFSSLGACANHLGGVVPLGNTILWMSTPFVTDATGTFASPCWISFHPQNCCIKPFFSTCSQFAWGSSFVSCPDGYVQTGFPHTGCCCEYFNLENCNNSCTEAMSCGLAIKYEPTTNTFVTITCFGCFGGCGQVMYYNYPNAGNTAQEIFGCCECFSNIANCRNCAYCNIAATTSQQNCSTSPFTAARSVGFERCNHDNLPGCTMQAFCKSFMYVHINQACSTGVRIIGWPCAIVYGGACCWNFGSTPCTSCSQSGYVGQTYCMGCNFTTGGRCGFSGSSYGWMETYPQCGFHSVCAFGSCSVNPVCSPRFVCTANGMPGIVNGAFPCGTGFYANGQPFSTCVFKLRFVDMF